METIDNAPAQQPKQYEDEGSWYAETTYGMTRQGGVDILKDGNVIANVPAAAGCYNYEEIFSVLKMNNSFMQYWANYMGDDIDDIYIDDTDLVDTWNEYIAGATKDEWTGNWDCEDVSELEQLSRDERDDVTYGWDRDRY